MEACKKKVGYSRMLVWLFAVCLTSLFAAPAEAAPDRSDDGGREFVGTYAYTYKEKDSGVTSLCDMQLYLREDDEMLMTYTLHIENKQLEMLYRARITGTWKVEISDSRLMLDITDDDISFEIEDFKIKRPEDIDPMYTEEDIKARYNDREAFLYICEPILFKIIGGVYIDEVSEKGLKIYPELDESESFWLKRM